MCVCERERGKDISRWRGRKGSMKDGQKGMFWKREAGDEQFNSSGETIIRAHCIMNRGERECYGCRSCCKERNEGTHTEWPGRRES